MKQFILVIVAGAMLFLGAAWQLGLLDFTDTPPMNGKKPDRPVTPVEKLGDALYAVKAAPPVDVATAGTVDPIVLHGVMNPLDQEEVASQVNGRILFIGEQVDDAAVLAAGTAAFLPEPYYFANIYAGRQSFVKFYRRIYDGETINQGQMLAMIEPGEALGSVLEEIAKVDAAMAEHDASMAAESEGLTRKLIADRLFKDKTIGREEHGTAVLTYIKLRNERISKSKAIEVALAKKDQADMRLRMYEIRPTLPYNKSLVKTIVRQRGFGVKQGDPVMVVQNLERLQAEALIQEQHLTRLKQRTQGRDKDVQITATIEPSVLEGPAHELPGHLQDVTSIAVSKDLKIVSGSEDRTVCVWKQGILAPLRKLEHDEAVRVVVCSPPAAEKNLCLAGGADGGIYLWDLDNDGDTPLKSLPKPHGADTSITSLAFNADGKFFASGASDGSIRMWRTDGTELYAFVPENGVKQSHDDAVTSLHFTPQGKLISASRDKTIRSWILKEKGAVADRKPVRDRVGNVPNLGVSEDGKWMLFDQGRTMKLYSVETQTLKHTFSVPANSTPFDTLAVFSPDTSMILTAGAPEGRLQLWRTPDAKTRAFEVRQFGTTDGFPVRCAAFSPIVGKEKPFAVSASGSKIYVWSIPTPDEVKEHRIERVRMTLNSQAIDPATKQTRIGFEVPNLTGRFEAGRPVTIVID